jgi:hypothetical protein
MLPCALASASTGGTALGLPEHHASMAIRRAIKPPPLGQKRCSGGSMPLRKNLKLEIHANAIVSNLEGKRRRSTF